MGIRLNPGRTGRRVLYKFTKKDLKRESQEWNDIWETLYKVYPNLQGHVDASKLYQDLINALPELNPEIQGYVTVDQYDIKTLSTILGKFTFDICKLYNSMLKGIPVNGSIS